LKLLVLVDTEDIGHLCGIDTKDASSGIVANRHRGGSRMRNRRHKADETKQYKYAEAQS
jgi:hypothetical protein